MKLFSTSSHPQQKYCYIPSCKAACCISPPLPEKEFTELQKTHKPARKIITAVEAPQVNRFCIDAVVPITTTKALEYRGRMNNNRKMWAVNVYTDGNYCPFLNKNYRCDVYENRPPICRYFGSETGRQCDHMLTKREIRIFKLKQLIKPLLNKAASLI